MLFRLLSHIRTTQAACNTLCKLAAVWHKNQVEKGDKWLYSITIEWLVCILQRWGGENKIGAAALAEGADSINAWLAHLFDDTVTSISGNISDGHENSADSGAVLKGANILRNITRLSHTDT